VVFERDLLGCRASDSQEICEDYHPELQWFAFYFRCHGALGVSSSLFLGPCSFIAICEAFPIPVIESWNLISPKGNILILRDQIHIEPPGRSSVSYEYLSNRVAEYLLSTPSECDPSSALSILPVTRSKSLSPLRTCPLSLTHLLSARRGDGPKSSVHGRFLL
jgi:hypothetical protein